MTRSREQAPPVRLCRLDELVDHQARVFEVGDRFVVAVRRGDQVDCLDDVCTHDGGTLSDGHVDEGCLVCPRHGARFDLATGDALTMPATEPTLHHPTHIADGEVWVQIIED